eukprot:SAG31_NODE_39324_length_289_cov_0.810526_1_plen_79_part_01
MYSFGGYAYYQKASPLLAQHFISKDGRSAMIIIEQDPSEHGVGMLFASFMESALAKVLRGFPNLKAGQTGYGPLAYDAV